MKSIPVSIVIPVYNVDSVVRLVLESVYAQAYPIREILLVDNHSSDQSVRVIKEFINNHKKIPIHIIQRKKTYGISDSYNLGVRLAKSQLVITLHSDSVLPTNGEIAKLVKPLIYDSSIVASIPWVVHRREEWLKYNFWQKCVFARSVGTESPSGNGKFDCYRKAVFMKIGGYDVKHFNLHVGAEDADMHHRLRSMGIVVESQARVIHMHGFLKTYSPKDYYLQRRFLSIAYGKYLKLYSKQLKGDIRYFIIKPLLALSIILWIIYPVFIIPFLIFPFVYMPRMYTDKITRNDPNIILFTFMQWYLIFAESIWMIKGWRLKNT